MLFCILLKSSKISKMHIAILSHKVKWFGGKGLDFPFLLSKVQFSKMTWVVVNVGKLIEYVLCT